MYGGAFWKAWEAEAGELLGVQSQPGLHRETLYQAHTYSHGRGWGKMNNNI